MKKFLITLVYFSIPLLLLFFVADYFISQNLKKSTVYCQGEYVVWNEINEGQIEAELVVYGASRAWVHFNPFIMEDSLHIPVYNLGIDGQNFIPQYLRHQQFLKFNKKPKVIVHSVDLHTFMKKEGMYNSDQFLPYMLFNKDLRSFFKEFKYGTYNFYDFNFPLIRYYGKRDGLQAFWNATVNPSGFRTIKRVKGFEGQDRKWNEDLKEAQKEHQEFRVEIDTAQVSQFEKFLSECSRDSIRVIMVYTPEHVDGQKFVSNRTELFALFKRISNQYKVPFMDYSADPICHNKNYFYNAEHLNKEGADLFTRAFVSDYKFR